jgi:hypothetical protein
MEDTAADPPAEPATTLRPVADRPSPVAAKRAGAEVVGPPPDRAIWTVPPQPPQKKIAARRLGFGVLGAGVAALAAAAVYRFVERPRRTVKQAQATPQHVIAARYLNGAAAVLSLSVLTDSGLEHFRGAFHNPAMYLAPTVSAISFINSAHMAATPADFGAARAVLSGIALATGIGGFGFHTYNLAKREGGISLFNLFYGAPLGAPWAVTLAGLAGLAASRLVLEGERKEPGRLFGFPAGPVVGWGAAIGLFGTVAEAALLHFRGAFHDPFMFLPVSLPPLTAAVLAAAAVKPGLAGWAKPLLQATVAMGVAGAGFHAYGVSRNMGGFYNWSQNLLNGPPLPAPPSFSGVALAGLGALRMLEAQ